MGDLALRLALPYPFAVLRFQRYLATALFQVPLVAAIGGMVIWALGTPFTLTLWSLPALALSLILNFLLELTFALLTFRATSPMALGVLLEMLRLLGGAVVLPLEFWPAERDLLLLQPLAATFYLPARVAAGGEPAWLLVSLGWILVFIAVLVRLFPRALAALSRRGEV
ncbi:ABC transporter permease [Thermus sp. FJN-A]